MAGVQPLSGYTPAVTPTVVDQPGVVLDPSVMGGPYNPAHGQYEWDDPVPWSIQQGLDLSGQGPTVEGGLLTQIAPNALAGSDPDSYADPTATRSHGGPWPSVHIADSGAVNSATTTAEQSLANQELHSIDSGVVDSFTTQPAPGHKMPWNLQPDYNSQGAAAGVDPGGLHGNSMTGRDRFEGTLVAGDNLNQYGFDQAHIHRQNPAGEVPVPLNTTQGAQRPMVMNVPGRYEYPTGAGSPFAGQIAGVGNDVGAGEIGVPSDYMPPPDAPTNPPLQDPSGAAAGSAAAAGAPVWGWDGI